MMTMVIRDGDDDCDDDDDDDDEDDDVKNIDFNNDGDDEDYADACIKLMGMCRWYTH